MKTARPGKSDPASLRQNAEEKLKNTFQEKTTALNESDSQRLIHELQVHQLELEMQNEELLRANTTARDAVELYDFAPTGYFSVFRDSEIIRCNLSGATLLDRDRDKLKNMRFDSFISNETRQLFYLFLERVFDSNTRESCEVIISTNGNPPKYAHLTGIVTENAQLCLLIVTDLSEHKSLEALNEVLLSSLPYPAMYIRKKDMVVLTVNKHAKELGVKVGGQCWREFMKSEYLSDKDKEIVARYPGIVPADFHIRCSFCQADKCFSSALEQNDQELHAFGAIWDTYWIRVSSEVFLHYAVNVSERIKAEEQIRLANMRLRRFVDSDIVGIIIADVAGRIIECNDYYLDTIGYSRADFEAGKVDWRKITPPEWLTADEKAISELREKGKCAPYEKEYIRKDGSRVVVLITDALLPGPEEQIAGFILDITKRKRAEQALQESENKYRELIENSPDAIIIYSKGEIVLANKETFNLLEVHRADELIGKPVLQFVHPDYQVPVAGRMKKMAEDGLVLPINEERFIKSNGSVIDVEVKAMPVMFENKQSVQLIIRDITERKKAEHALRESEERNKALLEANPDLMFMLDENEIFVDFHSSSQLPLFTPAELFIGKSIWEVLPADIAELTRIKFKELFQSGQMQVYTYQLPINDQLRDFECRLVSCGNLKALSIVRDITERKQAEQELLASETKFRNLFEANSDGIAIFPVYGDNTPEKMVDLNENAAKMLGYTKTEMHQLTIDKIEKDRTPEKTFARKQELLAKGMSTFETTLLHKDGHEIEVEIKVMLISYNNQPALMNIVRDISDRKKAEIQLHKYAIELSKQIAEKNKFFSIIAHDLRGPFNGFLGLTQIMAEKLPELTLSEGQDMAVSMRTSAINLFRLLENLLHWARIEQGLIPFNPKLVHLQLFANECTAMALEPASKKGIELACTISDEIEVFADTNMLQAIIRNLISNAVKYTSAGGKISLTAQANPDNSVVIAVQDSGIGMNTAILDSLFRLNTTNNRRGTAGEPSTGLGLIICREFIEKHGGELKVESEVGKGSVFSFVLPGISPEQENDNVTEVVPVENPTTQVRGLKILIAEDDETSEMLISLALKAVCREILKVSTGADAVEACKNNPDIDLVMMDIKMPVMNGYEATQQIRKFNKNVVIIAQTAYGKTSDHEMDLDPGFNDFILKPVSIASIKELLQKHFGL